ncbi:MAG TPA: carbamoyl-phosphate synthase domain-containing protein, partial [Wenzhouxiangella sp.]|nr:carbamoyl-phosphate synthase domain-containing protein [Wenzhouxiangella sp.]
MKAILALEDGTTFSGQGLGAPGVRVGEVVFNTAMTGYQEILTDPSYAGQLVTLTASHVGNTGVNPHDVESGAIHAAGLIVRSYPRSYSNWRATGSLSDWMADIDASGIAGIDTRALTIRLRESGAQNGCLVAGESVDADMAVARARECASMSGQDLAGTVRVERAGGWSEGGFDLEAGEFRRGGSKRRFHVVCIDYGAKRNI